MLWFFMEIKFGQVRKWSKHFMQLPVNCNRGIQNYSTRVGRLGLWMKKRDYAPTNFPSALRSTSGTTRPKKTGPQQGKKRPSPVLNGNPNNTASNLWEIHQKISGSIGVITSELEIVKTLADEILTLINQSDPEFLLKVRNVKET